MGWQSVKVNAYCSNPYGDAFLLKKYILKLIPRIRNEKVEKKYAKITLLFYGNGSYALPLILIFNC